MPKVFLSPSTQEWNPYIDGGNEEQYMNLIADRMEPYLRSSGITYVRNNPDRNVAGAIADSNAGDFDVHLAIHSNAAPESMAGMLRGIDVYYSPYDKYSETLAVIIANNFMSIYPLPDKCSAKPTTTLGEATQTKAPAVLCEIGYHDNREDADWIRNNLTAIAVSLTQSLCDYFGIPLIEAGPVFRGTVVTDGSNLNLRQFPSTQGAVIGSIPNGSVLTVYSRFFKLYMATAIAPIPLASFAGQPSSSIGTAFLKSYAAICLEGCVIVLACVIFSAFASTPPALTEDNLATATIVWNYVGELIFNMLVLVGAIKMSDRIIRELMGLG